MKKLDLTDAETKSADVVAENIDALRSLFPDAFRESRIDFDVLKQLLGGAVDERDEKYGLNWHGKRKARQIALTPSTGTLLPCPEESVDWDTTQNLMIEGDNLEVLKLLQKSYAGQVKLIYIDPPYNTGKEFIYPDRFQDNLDTYLRYTGQKDSGGLKVSSNTESDGRFHTNWLNMMYPRLFLARQMLRDDGVILISIDEKEIHNLRYMCGEIFGEENFVAQFSVVTNYKGRNDKLNVAMAHEYILAFRKRSFETCGLPLTAAQIAEYKLIDDDGRKYKLRDLRKRGGPDNREDRPKMWFPLFYNETTKKLSLERTSEDDIRITPLKSDGTDGRWRWGKEKVESNLGILEAKYAQASNKWNVSYRIYLENGGPTPIEGEDDLDEDEFDESAASGSVPKSIWMGGEFSSDAGKRALKALLPGTSLDYPKSVELLKRCIYYGTSGGDITMDFFFGSGTFAQAIFEVEKENAKGRRFIGVQLPEGIDEKSAAYKQGFRTIADIAKARVKQAGQKVVASDPSANVDIGFRYYKLNSSNIRAWEPESSELEGTLLAHAEHLIPGRTEADVLTELLLKLGLDLCVPSEKRDIVGKSVHSIGGGALIVCLADGLTTEVVEELANGIVAWRKALAPAVDTRVVFKDSGFADDIAKTNMAAILNQNGILDVRSL
ncbi:adenine-specific DNA-methyltransferase [Sinorhizobium fredii]|uniref:site-specific DNA-methyltransferase n=1 Tax=Rhizobium fredii TaxID=380 RepID=UPI003512DFD2